MVSEYFESFVAGLHAPIRSKDDMDEFPGIGALNLLDDDELRQAEDMLIAKLAEDDQRSIRPLVEIRCTRAIPAMAERAASSPYQWMRDLAEWGMAELRVDRGLPAVLERLRDDDVEVRLQAVFDLRAHVDLEAEQAEEMAAFTDPDPLIRSAALDALFGRRSLILDAESFRGNLDFVRRRMLSPLPSVRAEAEDELRDLLTLLAAGLTRQQLWLDWRADQEEGPLKEFVLAVFGMTPMAESRRYLELKAAGGDMTQLRPTRQSFDYARLAGLAGRERKWVEDVLLSMLDDDVESVRAVGLLGVRRAIQPLRELLPITEKVPVAEIEAALRQLEG
jgi:HEAT repeat protein